MKVRDIIKLIEAEGWQFHSQRGSHRQYTHPTKKGRVTVAGKPGDDVYPKMQASIFQQAQMKNPRSN